MRVVSRQWSVVSPVEQLTKFEFVINLKTAKQIAARFRSRCCNDLGYIERTEYCF
jgi:hypothetical protein